MRQSFSTKEITGTVLLNTAAHAVEDAADGLRRVLTETQLQDAKHCAKALFGLAQNALESSGDEDQQEMIRRRMAVLRVNVSYVNKKPPGMVLLSETDVSTLIGHALNFCDLECACITMDDDTGERTVNVSAVHGCELRKLYKRIGLTEAGLSAECPYSLL